MGVFDSSIHQENTIDKQGPIGPRGIGYKLNSNGNYDIENKKLVNVNDGSHYNDSVNKKQMENYTDSKIANINTIINTKVDYNAINHICINFHEIQNLPSTFDNEDATNKYYVDSSKKNSLDTVKNIIFEIRWNFRNVRKF